MQDIQKKFDLCVHNNCALGEGLGVRAKSLKAI
jgi:hypothetical protein